MTILVRELRDALLEAGASPDKADAAAEAVVERQEAMERFLTKADFYRGLLVQTGVLGALMVALKLFG